MNFQRVAGKFMWRRRRARVGKNVASRQKSLKATTQVTNMQTYHEWRTKYEKAISRRHRALIRKICWVVLVLVLVVAFIGLVVWLLTENRIPENPSVRSHSFLPRLVLVWASSEINVSLYLNKIISYLSLQSACDGVVCDSSKDPCVGPCSQGFCTYLCPKLLLGRMLLYSLGLLNLTDCNSAER